MGLWVVGPQFAERAEYEQPWGKVRDSTLPSQKVLAWGGERGLVVSRRRSGIWGSGPQAPPPPGAGPSCLWSG